MNNLGGLCYKQGKLDEAEMHFARVLEARISRQQGGTGGRGIAGKAEGGSRREGRWKGGGAAGRKRGAARQVSRCCKVRAIEQWEGGEEYIVGERVHGVGGCTMEKVW